MSEEVLIVERDQSGSGEIELVHLVGIAYEEAKEEDKEEKRVFEGREGRLECGNGDNSFPHHAIGEEDPRKRS